ncbi:hypothetical protein [Actinomadura sp. WMMB 499]|uniref:hypothetical protein n=1 Tax=Actinomadura sp. WMMB 499 TaxID=1219491 RepID=UPI001245CFBA|nr:hypothetical protein [Actinomadura sp. WMMB 499]QFG26579.1 hypothetical protein F7P10_41025 [Actinomadura sp. WMMB 499]
MAHRRPDTPPGGAPVTADERARAAGTGDPGVAGDTHVAGPRPSAPRRPSGPEPTRNETLKNETPKGAPVKNELAKPAPPETAPPEAAPPGSGPARRRDASPGDARQAAKPGAGPDTRPDFKPDLTPEVRTGAPGAVPGKAPGESPAGPRALPGRLLDAAEADRLRARFRELQAAFVDDPRTAVRDADGLVTEAAEALARALAGHRGALADGMGTEASADAPDTERLRLTLRAYRDLLDRVAEI